MESTLDKDLEQATKDFSAQAEGTQAKETKPQNIYQLIEQEIIASDLPLDEKNRKLSRLAKIKYQPLNIMLVGGIRGAISSFFN